MIETVVIGAGRYPVGASEIGLRGGFEDSLIPSKVMESSIRRHWPEAKIINTYSMQKPWMKKRKNPTPFSLVRFMVPQLCENEGWAVYCDADQIVFADIRKMFEAAKSDPGRVAYLCQVPGCTGVVLMNTELIHWDAWKIAEEIDAGGNYGQIMTTLYNLSGKLGAFGHSWNSHDFYEEDVTNLLHFTNLSSQPWKFPGKHRLEHLWGQALQYAIDNSDIEMETLDVNCRRILKKARGMQTAGGHEK